MRYLLSIFCYLLLGSAIAQQQTNDRSILFLNGIGATSLDWHLFHVNAENFGYRIDHMNPGPIGFYHPHIETVAGSANTMNEYIVNKQNVLGIGHDGGGIILRKMANDPDTKLTGIILDGVPNQGSFALRQMLPLTGQPTSFVDDWIKQLEDLRSATNDCEGCDVLSLFKSTNDGVKVNKVRYEEYLAGHPTITGLGLPQIPYAVIWGNANTDNFLLERMVSSRGDAATGIYDDSYLIDCIKKKLDAKRQQIKNAQVDAVFNSLTGFFKTIATFAEVIEVGADGTPKVKSDKLGSAISETFKTIGTAIKDIRKIDDGIADLLECELIRNVMNASWNLIAGGGYNATQTTTITTTSLTPEECCWNCFGEPEGFVEPCITECYNNNDCILTTTNITTTVLTAKPGDGLYTKDEQLLAGAANTYECIQTNHFQEQSWAKTRFRFQLLFDGQNLAFKVPKI